MPRIQVTQFYDARSLNQPIAPGVYDSKDPQLGGRADYLVKTGRAHWIDAPQATQPEPEIDFQSMTIAQLKEYAAEHNIDLGDASKKDDIIAVLSDVE